MQVRSEDFTHPTALLEVDVGIDWSRASVSRDADPVLIGRLIEQQSLAYQSMGGWKPQAGSDYDGVLRDLLNRLHEKSYLTASAALRKLLTFPKLDDDQFYALDIPDLDPCWRVYPITDNPTFPPLWRVQAYRTLLPDQLYSQIREWKRWKEQVLGAEQDDYLRELHVYETSDLMRYHWTILRENVIASRDRAYDWAMKPNLTEICERILRLPEPAVVDARIDPGDEGPTNRDEFNERYQASFASLSVLLDLTRSWNSEVPEDWKVEYECGYDLTIESFRDKCRDPWLHEFLDWADRCAEQGFVLFLDY